MPVDLTPVNHVSSSPLRPVSAERSLAGIAEQAFDLAIIGGGITGVQVAREAAGRGARVVLVEKDDFGAGTSSSTSKLIHGGIRYLEQAQFGVVRESLRERRVVALGAPHLVEQRRFIMPGWRWSKPSTAVLGAGVGLYSALAFDRNRGAPASLHIPMPRWISKRAVTRAVPWLDETDLQGAWVYHDTMNIFPERLLLAYAMSAAANGAIMLNHVRATGFVLDGDTVRGIDVIDTLTGERGRLAATTVVNAAGPWADLVLSSLPRDLGVTMVRSKGVHLLTRPIGGIARRDTVFARARSGRHVIVSPWQGFDFIGPTDTEIADTPDGAQVESSDVAELLGTLNETLAREVPPMTIDDVVDTTVGVRPLIVDPGRSSYTASRRHEIFDHAHGGVRNLWSIGGGKWTTGRATAAEMVAALTASPALAALRTRAYDSRVDPVWSAFAWAADPQPFLEHAIEDRPELPLDPEIRIHLARLYGTDYHRVFDVVAADPTLAARISNRAGCLDIAAQVVVAVVDEAALTLADIIDRRLVLGTLGPVTTDEMRRVAHVAAPLFGWDPARADGEVAAEIDRRQRRRDRWAGIGSTPQPMAGS